MPGIAGTAGSAPVAITMLRVVRRCVPPALSRTSTVHGSSSRAWPDTTSTPSAVYRSTLSWGSMREITSRTRDITRGKSTAGAVVEMPARAAPRTACARRAAWISALLGTQPVFRQSPPMRSASTSVTRARAVAAM
jgi:hypothetical protein